jgi:putative FmdB family regulatory protein
MPLYEYECAVCAHAFERMVAVNRRDAKQACPECGAGKVARKVSTFAAQSGGNSADADWCAPATGHASAASATADAAPACAEAADSDKEPRA